MIEMFLSRFSVGGRGRTETRGSDQLTIKTDGGRRHGVAKGLIVWRTQNTAGPRCCQSRCDLCRLGTSVLLTHVLYCREEGWPR
ncbi:hypothetical protein O3P69_018190 [Scylla paramamosain]|uniref:Uncharacterized protein n=1 Tax=Scylla paramamosain TaxID=85552 RepID=A0AAW0TJ09_SCYPA